MSGKRYLTLIYWARGVTEKRHLLRDNDIYYYDDMCFIVMFVFSIKIYTRMYDFQFYYLPGINSINTCTFVGNLMYDMFMYCLWFFTYLKEVHIYNATYSASCNL